jgi:hypothetical protein
MPSRKSARLPSRPPLRSIAGAQWEGDWAEQFENSIMVEVNKTAAGVEKIIGDYRANRITVDFRAPTTRPTRTPPSC